MVALAIIFVALALGFAVANHYYRQDFARWRASEQTQFLLNGGALELEKMI